MSFLSPPVPVFLWGPVAHLPQRVVSNAQLVEWAGARLKPGWIEKRTGIQERRWVSEGEACSDLATHAAQALANTFPSRRPTQLILATVSGDFPTPPTSPLVQHRLGLGDVGALDLGAACAGFVSALHVGAALASATNGLQLLVAAEVRSRFLSRGELATAVLFGDGAAACYVGTEGPSPSFRLVATELHSDGSLAELISIRAGGSRLPFPENTEPAAAYLSMQNGAVLFLKAVEGMVAAVHSLLERMSLRISEIDWLVPHQANLHLLREVGTRLGVPPERMIETVRWTGNTSGASVGIALAHLRERRVSTPGQRVLLVAVGGGGLAAAALLEAC